MLKNKKGITLVALVVTIVVLLILAAVSINLVLGDNGIVKKAQDAKTKTDEDQENMLTGTNQLADEIDNLTGGNGGGSYKNVPEAETEETAPYFPDNTFTKKEGTIGTGLVIQDASGNEYVWVVVPTTVSKADTYPYTYVTRTQAQNLANNVNSGSRTSSLMFGLQWDLVLAFMSKDTAKVTSTSILKSNSTTIGNYYNNLWTIKNAKAQYLSSGKFVQCPNPFQKTSDSSILLTTGADSSFSVQNIYDIAGNVVEWTLENTSGASFPCAYRGGVFNSAGSDSPASFRSSFRTDSNTSTVGFRVSLF